VAWDICVSEHSRTQGLFIPLKAKEAGINLQGYTASPLSPHPPPYPVTKAQPSPHPVLREHVAAWGKIMSLPHFPSLEEALVNWGGKSSSLPDQDE
jgi:hypothetical protein